MPVRTVFTDQDDNELELFVNDKGRLYIAVGELREDLTHQGYITLDKEDVQVLISKLSELEKEMSE